MLVVIIFCLGLVVGQESEEQETFLYNFLCIIHMVVVFYARYNQYSGTDLHLSTHEPMMQQNILDLTRSMYQVNFLDSQLSRVDSILPSQEILAMEISIIIHSSEILLALKITSSLEQLRELILRLVMDKKES